MWQPSRSFDNYACWSEMSCTVTEINLLLEHFARIGVNMNTCGIFKRFHLFTFVTQFKIDIATLYSQDNCFPGTVSAWVRRALVVVIGWLFMTMTPVKSREFQMLSKIISDSKVHGANMGPIWDRQDPGGPQVDPVNFAIWDTPTDLFCFRFGYISLLIVNLMKYSPILNYIHQRCCRSKWATVQVMIYAPLTSY